MTLYYCQKSKTLFERKKKLRSSEVCPECEDCSLGDTVRKLIEVTDEQLPKYQKLAKKNKLRKEILEKAEKKLAYKEAKKNKAKELSKKEKKLTYKDWLKNLSIKGRLKLVKDHGSHDDGASSKGDARHDKGKGSAMGAVKEKFEKGKLKLEKYDKIK